ncbi:hypothetical protein CMUS01_00423 [Colletotrichum musicola]|uniref:Uncharacterized protein n=1 Tax=Colletotrichum musicola TaxID=2175873 RepID=A0A8H6NZB3_9PEZI|nr:hypothetical protein CMUS01_00423 [Colletotrichum musicola]
MRPPSGQPSDWCTKAGRPSAGEGCGSLPLLTALRSKSLMSLFDVEKERRFCAMGGEIVAFARLARDSAHHKPRILVSFSRDLTQSTSCMYTAVATRSLDIAASEVSQSDSRALVHALIDRLRASAFSAGVRQADGSDLRVLDESRDGPGQERRRCVYPVGTAAVVLWLVGPKARDMAICRFVRLLPWRTVVSSGDKPVATSLPPFVPHLLSTSCTKMKEGVANVSAGTDRAALPPGNHSREPWKAPDGALQKDHTRGSTPGHIGEQINPRPTVWRHDAVRRTAVPGELTLADGLAFCLCRGIVVPCYAVPLRSTVKQLLGLFPSRLARLVRRDVAPAGAAEKMPAQGRNGPTTSRDMDILGCSPQCAASMDRGGGGGGGGEMASTAHPPLSFLP